MKFLFLLACTVCAVSFSLLAIIYGTGIVPFVDPVKPEPVEEHKVNVPAGAKYKPDSEIISELKEALSTEKATYEEKKEKLVSREQEITSKQKVIETLKTELETLYKKVNEKIVVMEDSEAANYKRLADMFSKMEPDNAAELMSVMKPERAATVLNLIDQRQAAGILGAVVSKGDDGTRTAMEWSDVIRRMKNTKKKGS